MRHKIDHAFERLADALGTNCAIICFAVIAIVPLFFQLPRTVIEWQNWLSQTCIQLIALAVLQKGTRTEGRRQQRLIKETHDLIKRECFSCANHEERI